MNTTQKEPALLVGNDFISIVIGNKPFTIYKNDVRFPQVLGAVKSRNWEALDKLLDTAKAIGQYTFGNVHIVDGVVSYGNSPLHNAVVTKLLEFMRSDYPFEPLAKFLDKLMQNPSKRSVDQLYNYLERYKLPITEEGNFLGYKAVTPDFKDKHTNSIDNHLGANPKMPRNECEDDHNIGCAKSYHLGNIDYVKSFGSADDEVVLVEVNPKDVVSCPIECEYQKLRVCEYKVVGEIGKVSSLQPFTKEYEPSPANEEADDTHDYAFEEQVTNETLNPDTLTLIGADRAYVLHKSGSVVSSGNITINPQDNKSRSFFRSRTGWELS